MINREEIGRDVFGKPYVGRNDEDPTRLGQDADMAGFLAWIDCKPRTTRVNKLKMRQRVEKNGFLEHDDQHWMVSAVGEDFIRRVCPDLLTKMHQNRDDLRKVVIFKQAALDELAELDRVADRMITSGPDFGSW